MKGKIIKNSDNINTKIREILESLISKQIFNAIFVPVRVPTGESFTYLLIKDKNVLKDCIPLPPIMSVQGARAFKDLTRLGRLGLKILCVMRPCEIRAMIELSKLRQVTLEDVSFLSLDCPGVYQTADYIIEPEKYDKSFSSLLEKWEPEGLRPNCRVCNHFSNQEINSDLHIGFYDRSFVIVPLTKKGEEIFTSLGFESTDDLADWENRKNELLRRKEEIRNKTFTELHNRTRGIEGLETFFKGCINCHNCMRVCPICYCRQCFFESTDQLRREFEDYLIRTEKKGGIRFPVDRMLFHLGRMNHMSLSCVGCGVCEDGCPMDIPVGQIFNFVGDEVQKMFGYLPGRDKDEPIPVLTYKEDEFHEYEDAQETK